MTRIVHDIQIAAHRIVLLDCSFGRVWLCHCDEFFRATSPGVEPSCRHTRAAVEQMDLEAREGTRDRE